MGKTAKSQMAPEQKRKCHQVIHAAASAAAGVGAVPIPIADAGPISAIQVGMIVGLGKVFDIELSASLAKSIMMWGLTTQVGRHIFANATKLIPVAGSVVGAATAFGVTEALGWLVADDFYLISVCEKPKNIPEKLGNPLVKKLFARHLSK